jgi:hypothetical protein
MVKFLLDDTRKAEGDQLLKMVKFLLDDTRKAEGDQRTGASDGVCCMPGCYTDMKLQYTNKFLVPCGDSACYMIHQRALVLEKVLLARINVVTYINWAFKGKAVGRVL